MTNLPLLLPLAVVAAALAVCQPGAPARASHDKLAYLPFGLALPFATDGVDGQAH